MSARATCDPVKLSVPIKRGDDAIGEVALRRPKAGELRGLNLTQVLAMNVDAMITLIPRISTPPLLPAEVGDMDPVDFTQLADEVVSFFVPASQLEKLREMQAG